MPAKANAQQPIRTKSRPGRDPLSTNGHDPRHIAAKAAAQAAMPSPARKLDLTLDNGIVLRIRPVPQFLLRDAVMNIPVPLPPTWHNEARGEDEPNPNDPTYLKAMEDYSTAGFLAAGNAAMVLGSTCISVPDGYFMPDDDEWIEWTKYAGGQPDVDTPPARYLSWLQYHALRTEADQSVIVMAPLLLASLSEEEVNRSVDSFRNRKVGSEDPASGAKASDQHGDLIQNALSGADSGDGGAGSGDLPGTHIPGVGTVGEARTHRRRRPLPAAQTDRDAQ